MAVYLVTGRLGAGKSLYAVDVIRRALVDDRPVATNMDIDLSKLCLPTSRKYIYRLPDHPHASDLEMIGVGNPSRDESRNGVVVLDEAGTWLNSREWGGPERPKLISWLLHSRKLGWDLYLIVQSPELVDKQVRVAIVEHIAFCRRADRLSIPVISGIWRVFSDRGLIPQIHWATISYGMGPSAMVVRRDSYRPSSLKDAYDTRQRYVPREMSDHWGVACQLPAWHRHGRYQLQSLDPYTRMRKRVDAIKKAARTAPAAVAAGAVSPALVPVR